MAYKYAVLDIETKGLDRFKYTMNYIGIGLAEDIGKPIGKQFILNVHDDQEKDRFLKIVAKMKKDKIKLIWQNGKFDTLFIEHHYGILLPIHHDIMLMGTAFDLAASHALDDMAEQYLGVPTWDIPLKEKIKPNNPIVEKYLVKDLRYPWELFCYFMDNMTSKQKFIYRNLLKPAYLMYRNTERNGIYLDQDGLKKVRKQYKLKEQEKLVVLTKQYDINWNSAKQVADVFFNKAKMPQIKVSQKTGEPSADAKVLKRLASKGFELPTQLLDYKFYNGALSKFLTKWGNYASYDGRIHPSFGLTNVVTGRTSCSDPNLQQVPRRPELRTLFTAPKGRTLIEADYSQIELRIAADYANDPTMIKIYREGGDIHTSTGCTLAGCSPNKLTKEERSKAKPVNFGFLYGMMAKGFVSYAFDNYGIVFTRQEAERYRQLFFRKYSRLLDWHKEMEMICEAMGGVENRFGQFRALPMIYSDNIWDRGSAVRRAINTPVQGTASMLLVGAAIEIQNKLGKEMDLQICGTVHDSILADVPDDCVNDAAEEIKRIMAHPEIMDIFDITFKVPIEADIGLGAWGSK